MTDVEAAKVPEKKKHPGRQPKQYVLPSSEAEDQTQLAVGKQKVYTRKEILAVSDLVMKQSKPRSRKQSVPATENDSPEQSQLPNLESSKMLVEYE